MVSGTKINEKNLSTKSKSYSKDSFRGASEKTKNSNSDEGDFFEEFEFKPLSEGLGFHGNKFRSQVSNPILSNLTKTSAAPELTSIDGGQKESAKGSKSVDEVLQDLKKRQLDFATNELNTTPVLEFRPSSIDLSAVFLDGLLVSAMFLTSLILFLLATRIDLVANLRNPDAEGAVFLSLGLTLAMLGWVYLVVTRVYGGKTAGEWVFDQTLGLPDEQKSSAYTLKVFARSTIIVCTGFVTIPLINEFFQKDILEAIFKTTHYRKV